MLANNKYVCESELTFYFKQLLQTAPEAINLLAIATHAALLKQENETSQQRADDIPLKFNNSQQCCVSLTIHKTPLLHQCTHNFI